MAVIYGDMLAAFPELIVSYNVFTMHPLTDGGFSERKPYKKVRGWLTESIGGEAGHPDDTFSEYTKANLYLFSAVPIDVIKQGAYVVDQKTTILYKFQQDNVYSSEGGFVVHKLLSVEGPTDEQLPMPIVSERALNDY